MADDHEPFATPRLIGDRFHGGVVPLEVLPELTAYRDLILEVAKHLYKVLHPKRARVPRGFEANIAISLRSIGEGSALPELVRPHGGLLTMCKVASIYDDARDLISECVSRAAANEPLPAAFPSALLSHFERFGKRLLPDEAIELRAPSDVTGPRYTREVRRKLILLSEDSYEDRVTIAAPVVAIDVKTGSFDVEFDGRRIRIPLGSDESLVVEALERRTTIHLRVDGIAEHDREDRVIKFVEVTELSPVPSNRGAFAGQMQKLRSVASGWLDGDGEAPSSAGLQWFEDALGASLDEGLIEPRLYPTLDGNVQAEWSLGAWEVVALFDLEQQSATISATDTAGDDKYDPAPLGFDNPEAPRLLAMMVGQFAEGPEE